MDAPSAQPPLASSRAPHSAPGGVGVRLDDEGFSRLFRAEYDYVARSLRRLGVPASDLDDRVHDVFVAVYRHRDAHDPARPVKPWLFGFAMKVASDHRRGQWSKRAVFDDTIDPTDDRPDAADQLDAERDRALVLTALDTLEFDRRVVFVMVDIDGVAQTEAATTLGIPVGTVYSRLRLAREDFAVAVKRLRAKRGER